MLDRGIKRAKDKAVVIWLVKWKNLPKEDVTWELADELKARYPHFHP